jgi:hypothetical protein
MARAHLLLGCYRISAPKDLAKYVMALGIVLAMFSEPVIAEATSPATGIQTMPQFASHPPKPTELKAYCQALANHRQALPADFRARPYSRYWHEPDRPAPTAADRDHVAAALERFKRAIKPMEERPPLPWHSPTDDELYRRYGRRQAALAPIPFD